MQPASNPNLEVLISCCRYVAMQDNGEELQRQLRAVEDWDRLVDRAMWHNVVPVLYFALQESGTDAVPAALFAKLRVEFEKNRQSMSDLTNEMIRIVRVCESNGVDVVPFKGPALASQSAGNVALRTCSDLDFLVRKEQFDSAMRLVEAIGYIGDSYQSAKQAAHYRRYWDQEQTVRRDGGIVVEMHWAVVPRLWSLSLDYDAMFERTERLQIEQYSVATLGLEDLILVLCIHGSKETWRRLKWVNDVAILLHKERDIDWDALLDRARRHACERILLVGLGLASRLFDVRLPGVVTSIIEKDTAVASLLTRAIEGMQRGPGGPESFWAIDSMRFAFRERMIDKTRYAIRTLFVPNEKTFSLVSLPDALFWMYYPLRWVHDYLLLPVWLVGKRLRSVWSNREAG